jgi:hypothetical protein
MTGDNKVGSPKEVPDLLFNMRARFEALVRNLGGYRELPGVPKDTPTKVTEITHPQWRGGTGAKYDHKLHASTTENIRRKVLRPLGLILARKSIGAFHPLQDHGVAVADPLDGRAVQGCISAPYLDLPGIPTNESAASAEVWALQKVTELTSSDLRGIVLGFGAYNHAAVDLLTWPRPFDHQMRVRFERATSTGEWPPPDRAPTWFLL